jgi:homoserine kinase type II
VDHTLISALHAALERYDLSGPAQLDPTAAPSVSNLSLRVRAGKRFLRCKLYTGAHDLDALRYEQQLLETLGRAELPFALPVPLADRQGQTLQQTPFGWLALVPDLAGETLDPASVAEVEALGVALGALHAALAALPTTPRPGRALFQEFVRFPPPERDPLRLTAQQLGIPETAEAHELLCWWRDEAWRLAAFADGHYRLLPQQLCHNDPAPYNVLVAGGAVTAFIDFEFACPAPRGLDVAMALRMTMRTWLGNDPWASAEAFCRGYARAARLSLAEAELLPELFRLRAAMGIIWALGRGAPLDGPRILEHIGYLRNTARWLDQHGAQFATLAVRMLADEEGS